ncbi:hypothetical protein [Parasphingorhabdus pacifica]
MNARRMTFLLVRTLVFFVVAVVVVLYVGWSWPGGLALLLIGLAAAAQGGAVLWLRRSERASASESGTDSESGTENSE